MLESAAIQLEWEEDDQARRSRVIMRRRYCEDLRNFLSPLPPDVVAEVMAASEKVHEPVRDVGLN